MATFTATANSSSTIGYAQYGNSSWSTGSSAGACQGAYQATSSSGSRVGALTGTFYNNTPTHTLSESSNAALFSV